jgi:hypothetical protein
MQISQAVRNSEEENTPRTKHKGVCNKKKRENGRGKEKKEENSRFQPLWTPSQNMSGNLLSGYAN